MSISFQWNTPPDQIINGIMGGDKAQLFMAGEMKRLMDPYVPMVDGTLKSKIDVYIENHTGIVHYTEPYAHFQYAGVVMVGVNSGSPWANYAEGKTSTGKQLKHSTFRHPLATSEWDKAMMTARGEDLQKAMQNYISKGGG